LNEDAIAEARAGLYPDAITADVSEERLRRFFVKEAKGYRVRREVREMVLFAVHDLLKDAPFSRIDLISCRNLLIYLNREAQKRAIDTFHFALRPEGRLFLGSSETVDDTSSLFHTLDKKHRIYAQVPSVRTSLPVPAGPGPMVRLMESQERGATLPVVHGKRFLQDAAVSFVRTQLPVIDRATLTDLHFRLLERLSPPSVIVNQEHEIVHLSEHAGRFMQLAGGEPTNNILRIVHPMLRIELRAALLRAAESDGPVEIDGVPVELEGQSQRVDIRVFPAREVFPGLKLIVFHVQPDSAGSSTGLRSLAEPEPALRQLERELERMKLESRNTVEQYEASTEELKASNEELQAMNEELRSATEELETSREELQSINEELTTVNLEMKTKVEELAHANSDLQNLMASTSIAIIFLDRSLAITRYTPSAVDIFHLIPGDLGRPLSDLKSLMQYPDLIEDAENVLKNLIPIEREVREGDRWFLARLQPYRTLEDHIAGVVLILVDITERIRSAAELKEKVEEVLQFNKVAVGRENRMIDLKKEVNELAARLGETARYSLEFEEEDPEPA
jgi:two-component system CheB/CheR fusion protein